MATMSEQQFENEFHRILNLLAERGFAKRVYYDSARKVAAAEWTEDGVELQRLLRRLFDIPNTRIYDLTDRQIGDLITVMLGTTPADPIV